ncbi:MAG TPA: hypothetical protein VM370_02675 [Candidatus Thermoplasmatota archaeon]|nr:hypothetical protein [Candidatus Thermoplasmatota archaeon]
MIAKLLMAITMALTALGTPGTTSDVFEVGDHYMSVDDHGILTLWAESNGQSGLQEKPVIILGQVIVEPDHKVQL